MHGRLQGQVAIITGGASGIGVAASVAFAEAGARVVTADRNFDGAKQTADLIRTNGQQAVAFKVDVAIEEEVEAMVAFAISTYGAVDCAVNNAGIGGAPGATIGEMTKAAWDEMIAINLTGVFLCLKHELRHMAAKGKGAIVNTASVGALMSWFQLGHYTAAKHGVLGLTKSVAVDYGKMGIRCNAVCPNGVDTPMVDAAIRLGGEKQKKALEDCAPLGRFARPDEVAEAILWLCSDAASLCNGSCIKLDGGGFVF